MCSKDTQESLLEASQTIRTQNQNAIPRDEVTGNQLYIVEENGSLGRHLVASRNIQKGEVIIQEFPLVAAPQKVQQTRCLICPGCFGTSNEYRCEICGWPLCCQNCTGRATHEKAECIFLIKKDRTSEDWHKLQDALMLIRCVALRHNDDPRWSMLLTMESNWSSWSRSCLYEQALDLIHLIRTEFIVNEEDVNDELLLKLQAIIDINAFELKMPEINIQGCYKFACLTEHSCLPNTFRSTSSKTLELTLRASENILKGSHITTTYCDLLWPTSQRQNFLLWSKFFKCTCARCIDNSGSELGSMISSIMCPTCITHPICPTTWSTDTNGTKQDFNAEADHTEVFCSVYRDYKCSNPECSKLFESSKCRSFELNAEQELQRLEKSSDTENYEKWLEKWTTVPAARDQGAQPTHNNARLSEEEKVPVTTSNYCMEQLQLLHPQHACCLDACHTLFLLYSADSEDIDELTRKEHLGEHLLKSTSSILRGISMFHGTIMYELAITKASLFVKYFDLSTPNTTTQHLKALAQEIISLLNDALRHLAYESEDQPEGKIYLLGTKQLQDLSYFIQEALALT